MIPVKTCKILRGVYGLGVQGQAGRRPGVTSTAQFAQTPCTTTTRLAGCTRALHQAQTHLPASNDLIAYFQN